MGDKFYVILEGEVKVCVLKTKEDMEALYDQRERDNKEGVTFIFVKI